MISKYFKNTFSDYIGFRLDIISNNPDWWLGIANNELPSYEYYLKNCVEDKNGKYDFTVRRYKTHTEHLPNIDKVLFNYRDIKQIRKKTVEYSIWMGTPFNFKIIYSD